MKTFTKPGLRGSVMDFINTLCNFIALNIIFLITCLPVITTGVALTALYQVTLKEAKGEYGYLVRTYLREFKNNWKTGTLAFLALFGIGAVLLFNLAFWFSMGSILSMVIVGILIVACICYILVFTYIFPLLARFENGTIQSLKNAFYLALVHKKMTLWLLLIDALTLSLCLFFPPMKLFMVLFGFAFLAYCKAFLFNQIFAEYEEEEFPKI
ncbi:YesL family protein [Konateibacter massiliensis]|uniref:YesL family protein n=1 Tax=Konateibacter massiliensis TaxID=2002841 RepID=UPI000C15D5D6|nr:DUF624 domain-containing protein [Konateibacter massiliensis]